MRMQRGIIALTAVMLTASVASATDTGFTWVDIGVPDTDPNFPLLPASWSAGSAPVSPANGDCFYYLLENGANADSNGGSATHFDPEGTSFGSFAGQAWVRFDGLFTNLKTDADAAFGVNAWTVKRMWLYYDAASFSFGTTGGVLSMAEVSALNDRTFAADWGNPANAEIEDGDLGAGMAINPITQLPLGYHGFTMVPTAGSSGTQRFKILDETVAPLPTTSNVFQKFTSGMTTAILPISNSFTLYTAPIDDYDGGQGYGVALSFNGFSQTFGRDPILLVEICKQDATTSNNFPSANDSLTTAPFSTVAGNTCSFDLTATDADVGDTLVFSVNSPGSEGGTIVLNGAATTDGAGNWTQNVTYTIPANVRNVEVFSYEVTDGSVIDNGSAVVSIRGDAAKNAVALGTNSGSNTGTLKIYNGFPIPNGGTSPTATRDELIGASFMQSVEFDNYDGISHNHLGNILALNFGASPTGPGSLYVHASQANCDDPGATLLFDFSAANLTFGDTRVSSVKVSPSNHRIAVWGRDTETLIILNYAVGADVGLGGPNAASVSLNKEIDLGAYVGGAISSGLAWLSDNTVAFLDTEGSLYKVDVNSESVTLLRSNPRVGPGVTINLSATDIVHNPSISPYVYVLIGEFLSPDTINSIYVTDLAGNIVQQSGQDFTLYDDTAKTFREGAFDCYGNLYVSHFVDFDDNISISYIAGAAEPADIVGGSTTLTPWRVRDLSENAPNFSGLDIAAGSACEDTPPNAYPAQFEVAGDGSCIVTLTGDDFGTSLAFNIASPGDQGGALVALGAPVLNGLIWEQQATYTPVGGFRGLENFTFYVTDDQAQDSNIAAVNFSVRSSVTANTVAYGGNSSFQDGAMILYYGAHVLDGGTAGGEESLLGVSFSQSAEFDNYDGVAHNPAGNLLALNFGTSGGGGTVHVYATQAVCDGNQAVVEYNFDGSEGPLSRVAGLSVSQDNTKLGVYGYDTQRIFVMNYATGVDVGLGGPDACDISLGSTVDVSSIVSTNATLGTAWLDNGTMLWASTDGDLYTVDVATSALTLRVVNPRGATVGLQTADIEFNADISPYVYVMISAFSSPNTQNTLYVVDPATWTVVNQGGANAAYTDHSGTETFREIAFDTFGNLFLSRRNTNSARTNVMFIPNAKTPASIADNSYVAFNDLDAGQDTESFNGLDVALGEVAVSCALPGDMNSDGFVDGDDIQGFVNCLYAELGGAPSAPCACADVDGSNVIDSNDVTALVALLLS